VVVKPSGILIRRFGSKEKAEQFTKAVQKTHRPATGGDDDDPSQYIKPASPKPEPYVEEPIEGIKPGSEVIVKTESGHTVATTTPKKTIQELTSQGQIVEGIYHRPLSGGIGHKTHDIVFTKTPQERLKDIKYTTLTKINEREQLSRGGGTESLGVYPDTYIQYDSSGYGTLIRGKDIVKPNYEDIQGKRDKALFGAVAGIIGVPDPIKEPYVKLQTTVYRSSQDVFMGIENYWSIGESGFDKGPLGASTEYMKQRIINREIYDRYIWDKDTRSTYGFIGRAATSPPGLVISSYMLGSGIGSLKAASPTLGTITQAGLVGKGTSDVVIAAYEGDTTRLRNIGLSLPFAFAGYGMGYRAGYTATPKNIFSTRFTKLVDSTPYVNRIFSEISRFRQIGTEQQIMAGSVRDYPFYAFEGTKPPVGFRIKSFVKSINLKEPSAFYYMQRYASYSQDRSDILLSGKPAYGSSDIMMSYKSPKLWGGYETSWSYYRYSLLEQQRWFPQRQHLYTYIKASELGRWSDKYLFDPDTTTMLPLESKPLGFVKIRDETRYIGEAIPLKQYGESRLIEISESPGFELYSEAYSGYDPIKNYRGFIHDVYQPRYVEPYSDFAKPGLPKASDTSGTWGWQPKRVFSNITPFKYKAFESNVTKTGLSQPESLTITRMVKPYHFDTTIPTGTKTVYTPTSIDTGRLFNYGTITGWKPTLSGLAFLEEGIYTGRHSYWDNVFKNVKQLDIKNIDKKLGINTKIKPTGVGVISFDKISSIGSVGTATGMLNINQPKMSMESRSITSNINTSMNINLNMNDMMNRQIKLNDSMLKTIITTKSEYKTKYVPSYNFDYPKPYEPYRTKPVKTVIPIFDEQKSYKKFTSKFFKTSWFGRGYRVRKLKIPRLKELLKGSVI